jgi:hypothetical protein
MFCCPHVQWLDLDGIAPAWSLLDPGRLQSITETLSAPHDQFPSIIFFVGKKHKSTALKGLYPHNNPTRRKVHEIGNLHIDSNTTSSAFPVIFADCTPIASRPILEGSWGTCHDQTRHLIHRVDDCDYASRRNMISYTHINLFFPFVQVVCVFADDLGGNKACARYLWNWCQLASRSIESPVRGHPKLVVVNTNLDGVNDLVQVECHPSFGVIFDSLVVLTSEVSKCPCDSAAQFLQAQLKNVLDEARSNLQSQHLLLNARHVEETFSHAIATFTRNPREAIDIFLCSNDNRVSPSHWEDHLSELMAAVVVLRSEPGAVVDFVSSALLVQAYPPDSHCGWRILSSRHTFGRH